MTLVNKELYLYPDKKSTDHQTQLTLILTPGVFIHSLPFATLDEPQMIDDSELTE